MTFHQPWASLIALGAQEGGDPVLAGASLAGEPAHRDPRREAGDQSTGRCHLTGAAGPLGRRLASSYTNGRGAGHRHPGRHGPGEARKSVGLLRGA